jgi:hypothetical protein
MTRNVVSALPLSHGAGGAAVIGNKGHFWSLNSLCVEFEYVKIEASTT